MASWKIGYQAAHSLELTAPAINGFARGKERWHQRAKGGDIRGASRGGTALYKPNPLDERKRVNRLFRLGKSRRRRSGERITAAKCQTELLVRWKIGYQATITPEHLFTDLPGNSLVASVATVECRSRNVKTYAHALSSPEALTSRSVTARKFCVHGSPLPICVQSRLLVGAVSGSVQQPTSAWRA